MAIEWIPMGKQEWLVVEMALRQAMRIEEAKGASESRKRDVAREVVAYVSGTDWSKGRAADLIERVIGED